MMINWVKSILEQRIDFLYSESMNSELSDSVRYTNYVVMKELEILLDTICTKNKELKEVE